MKTLTTLLEGHLDRDRVRGLRHLKQAVRVLHEEFTEVEEALRRVLPHFKEWTYRHLDMKPIWWTFEELYKADYHGTDEELYEVIVTPEGRLLVSRLP